MLTIYEVRGEQKAALRLLRRKFGDLPEPIEARVRAMQEEELDALFDKILDAQSLADLDLTDGEESNHQG
ncbi:MAG: DUF4351 domain-containing protein [Armatimonadota bacterium]|nr:DUF4351 domain-containing protein [Armatimonadota bacterium]